MKTSDINVRDPYILRFNGTYYLYGTRSATAWGLADGFDCYSSKDLVNWEGPVEIFHNDGSFWADRNYWAPECYYYQGAFYLVATFGSERRKKGTQILVSHSPVGPFKPHSNGPLTPVEWNCLDGTLYFKPDGTPYMIFGHSEDKPVSDMCAIELSRDLKDAVGKPWTLFTASEAPWAVPVPFAKQEFGVDGDMYFADGPFMHRTRTGRLLMLWSSWGKRGYTAGLTYSDNGDIDGNWQQAEKAVFSENGGHGMLFYNSENELMLALHHPNDFSYERPNFLRVEEVDDLLVLV